LSGMLTQQAMWYIAMNRASRTNCLGCLKHAKGPLLIRSRRQTQSQGAAHAILIMAADPTQILPFHGGGDACARFGGVFSKKDGDLQN
jgi:hypothetical protein